MKLPPVCSKIKTRLGEEYSDIIISFSHTRLMGVCTSKLYDVLTLNLEILYKVLVQSFTNFCVSVW